jgi:hypothetical protein
MRLLSGLYSAQVDLGWAELHNLDEPGKSDLVDPLAPAPAGQLSHLWDPVDIAADPLRPKRALVADSAAGLRIVRVR